PAASGGAQHLSRDQRAHADAGDGDRGAGRQDLLHRRRGSRRLEPGAGLQPGLARLAGEGSRDTRTEMGGATAAAAGYHRPGPSGEDAMKPIRTALFAPGSKERVMGKALESGADAVIFDLEDSVPVSAKAEARNLVAKAIDGVPAKDAGP